MLQKIWYGSIGRFRLQILRRGVPPEKTFCPGGCHARTPANGLLLVYIAAITTGAQHEQEKGHDE